MIKNVIFDLDGVIFDSETVRMTSWEILAEKYGLPDIDNVYKRTIGVTVARAREVFLEAYGEDFPVDERTEEYKKLCVRRFPQGLPVKPGVPELLGFLQEKGIKTAVASSTFSDKLKQELDETGLTGYFTYLVGGDAVKRSKPAPDIFLKAAKVLGADRESTLVIEDSPYGIQAAHAAGLRAVMVPDLLPATEETRRLTERVLPDLFAVKQYIENENKQR